MLPRNPHNGKPTTAANIIAGVAAGVTEAVTVVTSGENLKTKIVDDRAGAGQFKSSSHALRSIIARQGISGLYGGVLPVAIKQGSNSIVRFTSYNAILNSILPYTERNGLSGVALAAAGAMAGVVTVYATMPFDNIKTKMQALEGRTLYKNTWQCFYATLQQSGVRAFWKGTTPRLARLIVSGALSFSIYTKVVVLMQTKRAVEHRSSAAL